MSEFRRKFNSTLRIVGTGMALVTAMKIGEQIKWGAPVVDAQAQIVATAAVRGTQLAMANPPDLGLSEISEISPLDGFPEEIKPYKQLIMAAAEKYDLPPGLIAAIMWKESNFNPNAVSDAMACGLMQVVSNSNYSVNKQGVRYFSGRPDCGVLKDDEEFNIDFGVGLLRGCIDEAGGDVLAGVGDYFGDRTWEVYTGPVVSRWEIGDPVGFTSFMGE